MNTLVTIFFITYFIYSLLYNIKFIFIYLALIGIYYYIAEIKFFKSTISSIRRKIMVGTWGESSDPQIYSKLKLDITKIEPYLKKKSEETGEKITLTIFVIKLVSIVFKKYPQLYSCISFGKVK